MSDEVSPPVRLARVKRRRCETTAECATGNKMEEKEEKPNEIQCKIGEAAAYVFQQLGCGFSESVYRDALAAHLETTLQISADREVTYPVYLHDRFVGTCRADIVLVCKRGGSVNVSSGSEKEEKVGHVVVELKATNTTLTAANAQQLLAYMRLRGCERGVLVNFFFFFATTANVE